MKLARNIAGQTEWRFWKDEQKSNIADNVKRQTTGYNMNYVFISLPNNRIDSMTSGRRYLTSVVPLAKASSENKANNCYKKTKAFEYN